MASNENESSGKKVFWDENIPSNSDPSSVRSALAKHRSIRKQVTFTGRRFDVKTLPADLHRVYKNLERDFGEDYALTFVFIFRTGMELHRAWHMTLLTSKILQQIKDKFKIRMTWELGVIKLKFRVEDGGYELHRKVPYDYDSEFQDLYMKIAVALVDGHIDIHQALIFQTETKHGRHTARSGLFLRDFPGRLVLYPLQAATCAVIFFNGDWFDAGVAAVCGLTAGLVEYFLCSLGGNAKILTDVLVGTSTGAIAGLFYRHLGQRTCMPAIFLGTLYWFFYGTAFVLGILEIISGELETGVIRFMAVAVKTFVLTLGTTFGMQMTLESSIDAWQDQNENCGSIDLSQQYWRIPLYLLCSASALGQYRFPVADYWRGLIVQFVGYEVQYRILEFFQDTGRYEQDFLDTAASNVLGAMASVAAASILSAIIDKLSYYYNARVLQREHGKYSPFGEIMFSLSVFYIRLTNWLGFGKANDVVFLEMTKKLKKQSIELNSPSNQRSDIILSEDEEALLLEAIVGAEDLNIWALLMPTIYQLVPGSLIAKLWFNAVFPPKLEEMDNKITIEGVDYIYNTVKPDQLQEAVFQNLMVVSASLAVGLLLGFGFVQASTCILKKIFCSCNKSKFDPTESIRSSLFRRESRRNFNYTVAEDDPEGVVDLDEEFIKKSELVSDVEGGLVSSSSLDTGVDNVAGTMSNTVDAEEVVALNPPHTKYDLSHEE